MSFFHWDLTETGVRDLNDPSKIVAKLLFAVLPITVQRVGEDGTLAGPVLEKNAMIDTGATTSAVSPELAIELGLQETNLREHGQGGMPGEEDMDAALFPARITVIDTGDRWDPSVMVRPALTQYRELCQVLIGLDLLGNYVFTYNGPGEFFTLELPDRGQGQVRVSILTTGKIRQ
jgi:hypothetical protein